MRAFTLGRGECKGLDTSNAFSVRRDGEDVLFSIPGDAEGRKFELEARLPYESALNFAAWLAWQADPGGHKFVALYNEIKK